MTQPADVAMLVTLEAQLRELTVMLGRLESARHTLVPPPASSWRGTARHAYDAAMDGLATTVDAGIFALRSARDRTSSAVSVLASRG